MKYYDEPLEYLTGNATPKGEPEWIINNGKKMYSELSKETDEFFLPSWWKGKSYRFSK